MIKPRLNSFKKIRFTRIAILLLFLISSCEEEKVNRVNVFEVPQSIIEKLNSAGFDTSHGLMNYKNGWIVEFDIFLTEEMIDELLTSENNESSIKTSGRVQQYRTPNLVNGHPRSISIYMDSQFNQEMQDAFDAALLRYNALDLRLIFRRTTISATANIKILGESIPTQSDGTEILGISAGSQAEVIPQVQLL